MLSRMTRQPAEPALKQLQKLEESIRFGQEMAVRIADGQFLFRQLEDLAEVDFVRYTGPAPRVNKNPTAQGAGNPVVINAYTFIPKKRTAGAKIPLLIYVHGGVHGHVDGYAAHFLRKLLSQGYAVVAPEYRGSNGYGKEFWELIDYGGLETEDVFAAKHFMLENFENLDPERVGILGWSHGGLITLMNLFKHPKDFRVGYAGVPVSDLVARMGYKNQAYRDLYSALITSARQPRRTSTNIAAVPQPGTRRSCRPPCSSTRTRTMKT